MRKLLLYVFFLVAATPLLYAQDVKQYSFTHYGTAAGLLSNEVTSVIQDSDGYMWIGTNNGLQRFDGARYLSFRNVKNDTTSLPNNYVIQLIKDNRNRIWVLCQDQISILDTKRFTFKRVYIRYRREASVLAPKRLVTDDFGNVYLLCAGAELSTWNEAKGEFSADNNFAGLPIDLPIIDLIPQPGTQRYWMGTSKGFYLYDNKTKEHSYKGHNLAREPLIENHDSTSAPYNMFFDRQGRLWYDRWGDGVPVISCWDFKTSRHLLNRYQLLPILRNYHETAGYMQQKDGTIWVKGLGVFARYLENERRFQVVYNGYVNEQSIVYEGLTSLFEDRERNVWLGTSNNGLYRFAPSEQYFTNVAHINRETKQTGTGGAMSFLALKDGSVLVGTWGEGMFRYNKSFNEIPIGVAALEKVSWPSAWDMNYSPDSTQIFIGGQPGIYVIDPKSGTHRHYKPPIMKNRTVRQIEFDKMGNLWMGTQSLGIFKWSPEKGKHRFEDGVTEFKGIPPVQIIKLFRDRRGLMWITTSGHGVYVVDPVTDKVVLEFSHKAEDGTPSKTAYVADIIEYDDTTMVLAGGTSVHLFNRITKSMRTMGSPDFLNGTISSVQKDQKNGYLWISTTHGLHRVNINNNIFVHFDRVDGITDDRFVIVSSVTLPDGRIIFGSDKQFTVFNPDAVRINNSAPPVHITGFRMMAKPLLVDSLRQLSRVELDPKQNSITIEFSGLSFNSAYLIRYKLEGLDNDWKKADNSFQAVYSYLPAGTYTFLAKSEDADGQEGPTITRMVIKINPSFWQTWWFYGLIVLFAASILYLIDRERIKRLNDLQRVRTEIATNLHEDVTTTLSNINLLGEMAKIKADKDIDRSKEYIDQISAKSHNMIIAMDDILWSIDPDNDSMEKTLLRMMEFTDSLKNRHDAVIELALDRKVRSLKLDMKTRHEFFLIFKEGLRMIVQFAEGRNTLINIDLFRNKLSMRLQDSSARLDTNIAEIESIIKEINSRSAAVNAESDIQYDRNGIAIILMIPVR